MTYCVGLTGNIASGKSTVALLFSQLGVQVINADSISRQLTLKDTEAYKTIVSHFGPFIVNEEGLLNRRKLRDIIFQNEQERAWLEALLHPKIRSVIEQQVASCASPYCMVEIPLLKDKNKYPYLHQILVVTSPIGLQIKRIIKRDQCTKEQAMAIIDTQPSIYERIAQADDVLVNKESLSYLKHKVQILHDKYLQLSHDKR
jgi:dephospho-CoA kinase